ncbi:MAG: hypothetical protein H6732_14295 [Alphaproteobacteria bacterium]|nr:hypothetical protein [Alphaproteobacteria bacterium]
MSMILGALVGILLVPLAIVLEALLLRMVVGWVSDVELGLPMAVVTVVVAGITQSCASGLLVGADGGLVGIVVGWAAWSAMVTFLNGVPFRQALVAGVVLTLVHWALLVTSVVLLAAAGVGALAGLAASGL